MRAYLSKTVPNSPTNRVPWYRYAAPCYSSLFVWLGYTQGLAGGTIDRAAVGLVLFGLLTGAAISHWALHLIPATMGMQTGYPTGILGSSTFGSSGGRFVPGVLVGLVQVAWLGVASFYAAQSVMAAFRMDGGPRSTPFLAVALVWCLAFAFAGLKGLRVLSWLALLSVIPVLALLYGLFQSKEGVAAHGLDLPEPYQAFTLTVHLVVGFFATTAAASPAIGRYSPSRKDLRSAGLFGIVIPAVVFGGVAILTVVGARGLDPGLGPDSSYLEASMSVAGSLSAVVPLMLLVGAIPASAFIAWMAADSLGAMLPGLSRLVLAAGVAGGSFLVAVSGAPGSIQSFLTVAAALCAPLCGIIAADYWQHDKRWPHTRPGVNYAGFGAWLGGFVVGIIPLLPIPEHFLAVAHPSSVFACAAGFIGYIVFGNMGLKPYRKHRRKRIRMNSWADETPEAVESRQKRTPPTHHSPEHSQPDAPDAEDEDEDRPGSQA